VLKSVATVLGAVVKHDDENVSKLLLRAFPFNANDFAGAKTNDNTHHVQVITLNLCVCRVLIRITRHRREWIDPVSQYLKSRFSDEKNIQSDKTLALFLRVLKISKSQQQRSELVSSFETFYNRLPFGSSTLTKKTCVPTLIELIRNLGIRSEKWILDMPKLLWHMGSSDTHTTKSLLEILLYELRSTGSADFVKFLIPFFCALRKTTGVISIGPFSKLPSEIQQIAVSLIYYCGEIPKTLLRSLALCMSLPGVSLEIARLIVQVVGEIHRDGRLDLGSYLSFLISCVRGVRALEF
jgi:hypothetical protein